MANNSLWRTWLRALRPKQWVKNLLVLAPVLLSHQFTSESVVLRSLFAAGLFCLVSSAVYCINDIADVEVDRLHHAKRGRPFASGELTLRAGILTAIVFAAVALGLAWVFLGAPVTGLLASYIAVALLYSAWLKKILIVDIVVLVFLYVTRLWVGGQATGIHISSWTFLFSLFFFTSLASLKRYAELHTRASQAIVTSNRRAYRISDSMPILVIGIACSLASIVCVALYLGSTVAAELYRRRILLGLACPIMLAWVIRLWMLGHRGRLRDEDPLLFALSDVWSYIAGALLIFLYALSI